MKFGERLVWIAAGAILAVTIMTSGSPKRSEAANADRAADREAIRAHIEKIFQAYVGVDPETVRATHAQNWIGFTQTARSIVHGVDGYMTNVWIGRVKGPADLPPDALVLVDYKISEIDFAFYGDVALVPYIAEVHVGRAARIPAKLRSMDVYAKVNDEWTQVGSNIDFHPETQEAIRQQHRPLSPRERETLLAAREAVWRAWFTNDQAALRQFVPAETIAINAGEEKWQTQEEVLQEAVEFAKAGKKLTRLEFPRTKSQRFGDVAILYSEYLFETSNGSERSTTSGRATEVFVQRQGKWTNPGWHMDLGK